MPVVGLATFILAAGSCGDRPLGEAPGNGDTTTTDSDALGSSSGSAGSIGSNSSASTEGTTTTSGEQSSSTGEEPLAPICPMEFTCGDGVVEPGEGCDDANDDDDDGCTSQCERPPAVASVASEVISIETTAAVDADGSVLVVTTFPEARLLRLAADGQEIASQPIALPENVKLRPLALLVGDGIVLVGRDPARLGGGVWRFESDLTSVSFDAAPLGQNYLGADLAPDGDLVVARYSSGGDSTTIERQDPQGSPVWSTVADPDDDVGVWQISAVSGTSVFAVGGIGGLGEAAIMHVTPEGSSQVVLSPPDYPNAYFYHVVGTPDGGAVAVGAASGQPFVARVDALGELIWATACTDASAHVAGVAVVEDRIVLVGSYGGPPDCGVGNCHEFAWVQQLDLDGIVLATDAATDLLASEPKHWSERVAVVGRHPDGSLLALASDGVPATIVFPVRVPW